MSEFMLLIYTDQTKIAGLQPSDWDAIHADYVSITQAMNEAGVNKGGNPLQGADTARTVGPDGVAPTARSPRSPRSRRLLPARRRRPGRGAGLGGQAPRRGRGLDKIEVRPIQPFMM